MMMMMMIVVILGNEVRGSNINAAKNVCANSGIASDWWVPPGYYGIILYPLIFRRRVPRVDRMM